MVAVVLRTEPRLGVMAAPVAVARMKAALVVRRHLDKVLQGARVRLRLATALAVAVRLRQVSRPIRELIVVKAVTVLRQVSLVLQLHAAVAVVAVD